MKKFSVFFMVVMAAVMSFSFSSCLDDDEAIAYYLDGEWRGTIYSMDDQRYDVTMYFDQYQNYYATSGTGYEVDRGRWGRNSRMAFNWYVKNGNIYIEYADRTRVIVDYDRLPRSAARGERFWGYFVDWNTDETLAEFDLTKVD